MVTALVTAHDLPVGTYLSPHLERINERVSRSFEPIGDAALAAVLSDIAGVEQMLEHRPSYFELLTAAAFRWFRSEEHTSELQSLMRTSYAVFCLKKKKKIS